MGSMVLCDVPFSVAPGGDQSATRRAGREVLQRFADAAGLDVGKLGRIFDEFAGELAVAHVEDWQELQEQVDEVATAAISQAADALMARLRAGDAAVCRARLRVLLVEE